MFLKTGLFEEKKCSFDYVRFDNSLFSGLAVLGETYALRLVRTRQSAVCNSESVSYGLGTRGSSPRTSQLTL